MHLSVRISPRSVIAIAAVGLAITALSYFLARPQTLPQESGALADGLFAGDVGVIENHFFESEKSAYKMDERKRDAIRSIFQRCTQKARLVNKHDPLVQSLIGEGCGKKVTSAGRA